MTRRTMFLIGLLIELIAIFGLFLPYVLLLNTGTEITLKTVPVDPRSIFRGDYVVLSYEVGDELPLDWEYGTPLYAVLEPKGDVYERVAFSRERPTLQEGQVCLRGTSTYMRAEFPDIAQYFVEEDLGKQLESARNTHRLLVNVAVNDSCRGVIKSVLIGEEAPLEDMEFKPEFPPTSVPEGEL